MLVIWNGDRFGTKIYKNGIHPLKMCDWQSSLARKYKINLIKTMIYRVFKIVSGHYLGSEIENLKNIFLNSNYPIKILNNEINSFFSSNKSKNFMGPNSKKIYLGLNYLGEKTETFANKIKNLCEKGLPGSVKVEVYFRKNSSLLSNFSKNYKNYDQKESPCVYKIPCKNCNLNYVGETGRILSVRVSEHSKFRENSALSSHHKDLGHEIDFGNANVLFVESNMRRRKIVEALCIQKYPHFLGNTGYDLKIF